MKVRGHSVAVLLLLAAGVVGFAIDAQWGLYVTIFSAGVFAGAEITRRAK